jgi:hypothetical protein
LRMNRVMQLILDSLMRRHVKKTILVVVVAVALLIFNPNWLGMLIVAVVGEPPKLPLVDVSVVVTLDPDFEIVVASKLLLSRQTHAEVSDLRLTYHHQWYYCPLELV